LIINEKFKDKVFALSFVDISLIKL